MRKVNRIIHLAPQWPTQYQTFVRDDIEISASVFDSVLVYGFNTSEQGLRKKIFWLKKFLFALFGISKVLFMNPLIGFNSLKELGIKNSTHYLSIIGKMPFIIESSYILHCHFLAHTSEVGSHLARLNSKLVLVSTAHGSEVLLREDYRLISLANRFDFLIFASNAILENLKEKSIGFNEPLIANVSVRYCRTPNSLDSFVDSRNFEGAIDFLSIGRMHPQKGWDKCLYIAKMMKDTGLNFRWILIGDGPELERLVLLANEMHLTDHVIFMGYKSREYCLQALNMAHFTVMPSVITKTDCDGLPVVILEAMRASSIVISTEVGGIPEALANGRGLLFKNFDEQVIQVIESLIKNPDKIEKMRYSAKEWAIENTGFSDTDKLICTYKQSIIKNANAY